MDKLEVQGLREFVRELRKIDADFPKEMRVASKRVADLVAERTARSFLSRGGVAPRVAPSVKALAQQASASVRIGGERYPYAMGSNFGSIRYKQFPQFAGRGEDYSLYKSIRESRDEVVDSFGDAVERVARRVFPD